VCINDGEIDSLYVLDEYRNNGYGEKQVQESLSRLESRYFRKISVSVDEEQESVFGFNEKFGIYPRLTYLQRKQDSQT